MNLFMQGAIAAGFAVCSLFFMRYWKQTHDRLFVLFAIAFIVLGLNRVLLAINLDAHVTNVDDDVLYLYVIRLIAYCTIVAAIIDKNFRAGPVQDDVR